MAPAVPTLSHHLVLTCISDWVRLPPCPQCFTIPVCHPHRCTVAKPCCSQYSSGFYRSPCDLGQQICGIRPAALSLCNVSQTASCTSQSAPIQPDSSCTLLITDAFCKHEGTMFDVTVLARSVFERPSAIRV